MSLINQLTRMYNTSDSLECIRISREVSLLKYFVTAHTWPGISKIFYPSTQKKLSMWDTSLSTFGGSLWNPKLSNKAVLYVEKGSCRVRSVSRAEIQVGNSYKEPKLGELFIRIVHSSHGICLFSDRKVRGKTHETFLSVLLFWNLYTKLAATQQKMLSVSSRRMIGDLKNLPSGYLREVFSLVLLFQTIPCLIEGDKSFYSLNGLILTLT